jgi:hypothetical protein
MEASAALAKRVPGYVTICALIRLVTWPMNHAPLPS